MPNNLSNGFKETELDPLPEEWEVVRLGAEHLRSSVKSGGRGQYPGQARRI